MTSKEAYNPPLLSVTGLGISVNDGDGREVDVVQDVSFALARGETVAIVGESGCGKSLTAASILGLLPAGARQTSGSIVYNGRDLGTLRDSDLRAVRGNGISIVFQDPLSALNPLRTIGYQLAVAIRQHNSGIPRRDVMARIVDLLGRVRIPVPADCAKRYPHELSGGMRQRVLIAMAIANDPEVIVADEPTTALDTTIQAEILDLLTAVAHQDRQIALILITHDLGVVAQRADRVIVMYAGRIVEQAPVASLFDDPKHPYTHGLIETVRRRENRGERIDGLPGQPPDPRRRPAGCSFHPRCRLSQDLCRAESPPLIRVSPNHDSACFFHDQVLDADTSVRVSSRGAQQHLRANEEPVLAMEAVSKRFADGKRAGGVLAVDGVTLSIREGETFALVGESGSGKSTLARLVVRLLEPDQGRIFINGMDVSHAGRGALRELRKDVQIVVQDPYSSLNPRMRVGNCIAEPLRSQGTFKASGGEERVSELLELVGLPKITVDRYPSQLSGGQRQRVGIARALAPHPKLLVLDEPVSALDVSIQAQIVALLGQLREELGVAYLFITHDLSLARYLADSVAVMHRGHIVESGKPDDVLFRPTHPYTQRLLDAIPSIGSFGARAPK